MARVPGEGDHGRRGTMCFVFPIRPPHNARQWRLSVIKSLILSRTFTAVRSWNPGMFTRVLTQYPWTLTLCYITMGANLRFSGNSG